MAYLESVIDSRPVGYWPLNESTTTGTDYSGYTQDATKSTVGVFRNLSSGNGYASGLTTGQTVQYPLAAVFLPGAETTSGSIEFIFRPDSFATNATLFEFTAGNGVYFLDGRLSFIVGASSCSYTLPSDGVYHVVAVYSKNSIKLFVNGSRVDKSEISAQIWAAGPGYYLTLVNSGSIAIGSVALYKYELSEADIFKHYTLSRVSQTSVDIASQNAGIVFRPSDDNRIKTVSHVFPSEFDWSTAEMQDCFINSDGNVSMRAIPAATLSSGTGSFTSTEMALAAGQYLSLPVGGLFHTTGAVGGMFYLDNTVHNNANAYSMFALSNSSLTNMLHVYKNNGTVGNITLAQVYIDYLGVKQTSIVDVTPTAGLFNSWVYVFLTFDGANATLYVNNPTNFGQIDFATTAYPFFDSESKLTVGSDADVPGAHTWNSKLKMVTGYTKIPDIAAFGDQQTEIGSFTMQLNSAVGLNVSQYGTLTTTVGTGYAGILSESRITWHPEISNLTVSASIDDSNLVIETNNSNLPSISNGSFAPVDVILLVEFETDDSINDIPVLYDLGLEIFDDSNTQSLNSQDSLVVLNQYNIGQGSQSIFDNSKYDGLIFAGLGGAYVQAKDQSTGSAAALDGTTGVITNAPARAFKTVELLIRQQPGWIATDNYYYFDHITPGAVDFGFFHDGPTQTDKFVGFDTAYVNGQPFTSGSVLPYRNGWAHVVLTKAVLATGLIPLATDPGRFNINMISGTGAKKYGQVSYRHVGLYPNIFTAQNALDNYNQFIGTLTAVISETDARSVSDQGASLVNGSWQIYSSV